MKKNLPFTTFILFLIGFSTSLLAQNTFTLKGALTDRVVEKDEIWIMQALSGG
jgi:hypothetical protein